MFRISFITQLLERIKRDKKQNLTDLPSGIRTGLARYLASGEEILFTLRDFRAIYKAPRWLDSNTYFNSWFILTNHRIIIARNSSSFKKFRDIPYNMINQIDYEPGVLDYKLIIHSPGTVDIIEFLREVREHCEGLELRINMALESGRRIFASIYCFSCGSKVPKESKFCSECGTNLQT